MNNKQQGQTLVEVLVALSAVIVILGAITGVILLSLKQSVGSADQARASQLAQDGMELVKGKTDQLTTEGTSCLDESGDFDLTDTGNHGASCADDTNLEGKYSRTVTVESDPDHCAALKKVTVKVVWSDSACPSDTFCHKVPLTTCL